MLKRIMKPSLILSVLALVCAPSLRLMAQGTITQPGSTNKPSESKSHRRYILKDLGTFGGPASGVPFFAQILNNQGTVVGGADTAIPDPYTGSGFNFPSLFVQHAFESHNGVLTDLGTLPGANSSFALFVNDRGQIAGTSQTDLIDPFTSAPGTAAVFWKHNGDIVNLGGLGGNEGFATAINDGGQVIGAAANTIPDPFSLFGLSTQVRAFLWQRGVMRDLGTLGGPDALAAYLNDRGQIAGVSYTNTTPNDATGIPTVHPFLWEDGRMRDLGNLGGTYSFANDLNNQGQVVGFMNLPGDQSQHPFLWDRGRLTDLGTFGGSNGEATWLNDAGEVVGWAYFTGDMVRHAFVLRHGVKRDLGPTTGDICSVAYGISSEGQVVGTSGVCHGGLHALLWENGVTIDLNTVIRHNSALQLVYAISINDRGEIAGIGVPPGVSPLDVERLGHAFLLIPVDRDRDDDQEKDTTKTDSMQDQPSQEAEQLDSTGRTSVPRTDILIGETVAPRHASQGDDQMRDYRYGRFLRLRSPVRKNN